MPKPWSPLSPPFVLGTRGSSLPSHRAVRFPPTPRRVSAVRRFPALPPPGWLTLRCLCSLAIAYIRPCSNRIADAGSCTATAPFDRPRFDPSAVDELSGRSPLMALLAQPRPADGTGHEKQFARLFALLSAAPARLPDCRVCDHSH